MNLVSFCNVANEICERLNCVQRKEKKSIIKSRKMKGQGKKKVYILEIY